VEGNRIVVAWSGNQVSRSCPWQGDPNDIYYATSNDCGKTWARPLRVTDVAKDGITAARPQVAIQSGVIHLFYVQGNYDPRLQVWNQGPWPIYYQKRQFPD
jgi:Neuraminidase (sialidase)